MTTSNKGALTGSIVILELLYDPGHTIWYGILRFPLARGANGVISQ